MKVNIRGVAPAGVHTTNAWGLRGPEPPEEWDKNYTIVTIGGSTTHCFYLDDRKTWPYLLQEDLRKECPPDFKGKCPNVWIGNGGTDGQTTRAHIIFMKDIISKIRPDAVIFLAGINDLALSIEEGFFEKGNPQDTNRVSWTRWLYDRSRLLQVIHAWKKVLIDRAYVVESTGHQTREPQPLAAPAMTLPPDPKSLLVGLDEYRQNLKELARLGRAMNVRTIFLTQPILYEESEFWKGMEAGYYWVGKPKHLLSAASIRVLLDIYNDELLKVCREENLDCFDLASQIPRTEEYFYDLCHFTEKGADLVARKVTEYLNSASAGPQTDPESLSKSRQSQ
ncbi:MAG: SGNH/GDSL hydrolase family protein [Desulfomonile tiedjei]|nr:SGNH/GDSL hydrolase family protein [Desulfomonile tiedjei]